MAVAVSRAAVETSEETLSVFCTSIKTKSLVYGQFPDSVKKKKKKKKNCFTVTACRLRFTTDKHCMSRTFILFLFYLKMSFHLDKKKTNSCFPIPKTWHLRWYVCVCLKFQTWAAAVVSVCSSAPILPLYKRRLYKDLLLWTESKHLPINDSDVKKHRLLSLFSSWNNCDDRGGV